MTILYSLPSNLITSLRITWKLNTAVALSVFNYPVVPQEEIKEFLLVLGDKYRAVRRLRHTGSRSLFKSYFK